MKWTNKEHEFDELGKYLSNIKSIYVWGAGKLGREFAQQLEWLGIENDFNIAFTDNDPEKLKQPYYGRRTITPEELLRSFTAGDSILVIAANEKNVPDIRESVKSLGLEHKRNLFYADWVNYHAPETDRLLLPILMMYKYEKLYLYALSCVCTTQCTLNCEKCLDFVPYNANKRIFSLNDLCVRADTFFSRFDYVNLFHFTGGEPFINPHLAEFIEYIGNTYRNRIFNLEVATNGTCLPTTQLCDVLSKYNVRVKIDDYSASVPYTAKTIQEICKTFDKYQIDYFCNVTDSWFDILSKTTTLIENTEDALEKNMTTVIYPGLTCRATVFTNAIGRVSLLPREYGLTNYLTARTLRFQAHERYSSIHWGIQIQDMCHSVNDAQDF